MEILIKDGVRYKLWTPTKEVEEFEPMVKEHAEDIFGEDSLYFDVKKKIETATGEKTIPDAYFIDFTTNEFYIVEIELSRHPEYDHISKQIGKFISALTEYQTRQKIARILKDYVEADIVREKFARDRIGKKELYQFFLEEILEKVKDREHHTVVVIDKKTKGIENACNILAPKPEFIEFKTFVRENAENVRIHLFEPLHDAVPKGTEPIVIREETVEVTARKGKIQGLFDPRTQEIIIDGKRYSPSGAAKKLVGYNIDGWDVWKFRGPNGKLLPIDNYRMRATKTTAARKKVTAGEFQHKGNGIFILGKEPTVRIDAKKTTKEVTSTLESHCYFVTRPSSFYHQLRKKGRLLRKKIT